MKSIQISLLMQVFYHFYKNKRSIFTREILRLLITKYKSKKNIEELLSEEKNF